MQKYFESSYLVNRYREADGGSHSSMVHVLWWEARALPAQLFLKPPMGKSHRSEILPFHLIVCSIFSDKTVQKETELPTYSGNCCETPKPPMICGLHKQRELDRN